MQRIAVLTSGGDAPGMNAALRAVVRVGCSMGMEIYGVQWGYAGLIDDDMRLMDERSVSGIIQHGGTILGTSRSSEFRNESGQLKAINVMAARGIEGLIVIGGEGSLHGALELHKRGVPVVGVPASIDNDMNGTEFAIGVDTALNTAVEAVDRIRETASSHHRSFIIEVMGRNSGYLALATAVATGAEYALVPEVEVDPEEVLKLIMEADKKGKTHFIVIAAEGSPLKAVQLKDYIDRKSARFYETRLTVLGHLQRGGSPTAFDRLLSTRLGARAVQTIHDGISGKMISWWGGGIAVRDLAEIDRPRPTVEDYLLRLSMVLDR